MNNNENIKFVKGSLRFKQSTEKSIQFNVPLSGKLKELDDYQRNLSVNLAEVYDKERQKSKTYRKQDIHIIKKERQKEIQTTHNLIKQEIR